MSEAWIQIITIIVSNLVVIITFFGIAIALHIDVRREISEMKSEMKDFHTRLAEQDLQFKIQKEKREI